MELHHVHDRQGAAESADEVYQDDSDVYCNGSQAQRCQVAHMYDEEYLENLKDRQADQVAARVIVEADKRDHGKHGELDGVVVHIDAVRDEASRHSDQALNVQACIGQLVPLEAEDANEGGYGHFNFE